MADIIIVVIVATIVSSAIAYIRKEKKRGVRCVGCSDSGSCRSNCSCSGGDCNCSGQD